MDTLNVVDYDGVPVVAVSGELDVFSAPTLDARLGRLLDAGRVRIIVDLDGLDFVDCGGLGALVRRLGEVRSRDGDLAVVCTRRSILRVFELTGLDRVFPIASTSAEAVAALTRDSRC